MNQYSRYLNRSIFLATCVAFAFTSAAALGCGDDGGGPTVDSTLLGIYRVDSYQGSTVGCEQPEDLEPAPVFVLLYSFLPNDDPDEPLLGGIFCGTIDFCLQAAAEAPEPQIGYSFIQGDDDFGWRGWAISSSGIEGDQCRADVQAHVLTSTSSDTINIETKTFATVFDGDQATDGSGRLTCRNAAAIEALRDDPPCSEILALDATFERGF